jgi:DNA-binding CsgD family transcriptional regulator
MNKKLHANLYSLKQRLGNIPLVIRYGLLLALALIALKTAEYQIFSFRLNQQLYVGLIAVFFLILGIGTAYFWSRFRQSNPTNKIEFPTLTVKELKLLQGLVHGKTNQQLADSTFLSINTVKTHLKSIYRKLAVVNRAEAAAKAKSLNLLDS